MPYLCSCCGETHEGLPDIGFDQPAFAYAVPKDERSERVRLNEDYCVVDDRYYFIRAVLEIPVHDHDQTLGIGVWVSQKDENFNTYVKNPVSADIGPFFGWLSTDLRFGGESSLHLKTMAHFRGDGQRPYIVVELTDHPLSVAQRNGLSLDAAWAFIHEHLDLDSNHL